MNLTRKSVRMNESGFTLVELMIVVAIIGILAAVAIPNFQKYQAKARQSEAKLQLSAAYTALQSFQAEHRSYSGCLAQVGYAPEALNRRYYAVGFSAAPAIVAYAWDNTGAVALSCADAVVTAGATGWPAGNATVYLGNATINGTASARTDIPASAAMTAITFELGAGGSVSSLPAASNDQWEINHTKSLLNVRVGI